MRSFLAFLILTTAMAGMAQESLFPEFSEILDAEENQTVENAEEIFNEESSLEESQTTNDEKEISEDVDLFKEKEVQKVETSPQNEEKEPEETEEEKKQKIEIGVIEVNSTLAPNRNMSFCSVKFGVENKTKKELNNISGNFTIGTYTKQFKFSKVEKGGKKSEDFYFVGDSCEQEKILAIPAIEITKCQIQDWSEKKCRSKVEIISVTMEENSF